MAGSLKQVNIRGPGFYGLNTEHAASNVQDKWATQLDNAIFSEDGKIACREGINTLADSGPTTVDRVFFWRKDKSNTYLMAGGNDSGTRRIYNMTNTTTEYDTFTSKGTTTTTDILFLNVNGYCVVLEEGETPQVWDGTGNFANFAAATGTTANPTGGIGCTAFGRLFVVSNDRKTVLGSELQPDPKTTGINWDNFYIDTTGNSGATASDGWVYGRDFITAVFAFQEFLCVAGREMILIFQGVNSTLTLQDSITGVGVVNQHTVQHTGDDVLFLSNTGVRSLKRTIEHETAELTDVSAYVRTELLTETDQDNACAVYDPQRGMYVLSDGSNTTYYFDTKTPMPGGALRASKWSMDFNAATYDTVNNRLFLAHEDKVAEYDGYDDHGNSYKLTLKSAWLDFGNQQYKIAKKISGIIQDGDGYTPKFTISYDFDGLAIETYFGEALPILTGSEWNVDEWGLGEWGGYIEKTNLRTVQASGSGLFVRYGMEFIVDGYAVGIHELTLTCKLGRLAHG